jgi:hypothetical protein
VARARLVVAELDRAGVSALPFTVNTETVPSLRLATSASVPCLLNDTPAAPAPALSVAITTGGAAFRSITVSVSSATTFVASAGSSLLARVTSAIDSSGETATLIGGPTTLVGTFSSASTFGGFAPASMMVTVSGGGLATTLLAPLSSVALLSFAETTICAVAPQEAQATAHATTVARMRWVMVSPLLSFVRAGR